MILHKLTNNSTPLFAQHFGLDNQAIIDAAKSRYYDLAGHQKTSLTVFFAAFNATPDAIFLEKAGDVFAGKDASGNFVQYYVFAA